MHNLLCLILCLFDTGSPDRRWRQTVEFMWFFAKTKPSASHHHWYHSRWSRPVESEYRNNRTVWFLIGRLVNVSSSFFDMYYQLPTLYIRVFLNLLFSIISENPICLIVACHTYSGHRVFLINLYHLHRPWYSEKACRIGKSEWWNKC